MRLLSEYTLEIYQNLSNEDKISVKVEEFVDHMKTLHVQVKQHFEDMNNKYKEKVDEKRRHKEFKVGVEVMVYLRKEIFLIGTYNKLKIRKFGPCKILRKFSSRNTYEVELLDSLGISMYLHQYHESKFSEDSIEDLEKQMP